MIIEGGTKEWIKRKANEYEREKEKARQDIEDNFKRVERRLEDAKKNILKEIDARFGENPFATFLYTMGSTDENSLDDLFEGLPQCYGPEESAFTSLCDEIDSLETVQRKAKRVHLDLKLRNISIRDIKCDQATISWDHARGDYLYEIKLLPSSYEKIILTTRSEYTFSNLKAGTKYIALVRVLDTNQDGQLEWSDGFEFQTKPKPKSFDCNWKECPGRVSRNSMYDVNWANPKIATATIAEFVGSSTIIGNKTIPRNKVTSWYIKVLESRDDDGSNVYVGVAPSDINQNDNENYNNCGWYFNCHESNLWSGPPHKYEAKAYGFRKKAGKYIHNGDSVGVVMNTKKGELSFVLNGVNHGVAYEGIPLDKPLVPCVILGNGGDSIELDISEVKEKVDSTILVPSNILLDYTNSGSIILTWESIIDLSYQVEVDGSIQIKTKSEKFTIKGLPLELEHNFRVRVVKNNSVGEWSDIIKGGTQKRILNGWKECPDNVNICMKYAVDKKNPKIAKKINDGNWCIIISNTYLPHKKVTSWSIKVLKSKSNDGNGILIGVAPSDINQDDVNMHGWYFDCHSSTLWSGLPRNYKGEEYGPRKENGQYVHTRDSVGVVMDTKMGELSFVLNGVNHGSAYKKIPLDKPLVPCVLLHYKGDSVELVV